MERAVRLLPLLFAALLLFPLVLDGAPLGAADRMIPWRPQPGAHTLSLMDSVGSVVDTVAFRVRGGP